MNKKYSLIVILILLTSGISFGQSLNPINPASNFCSGATFKIAYESRNLAFTSSNVFTVELSQQGGSFAVTPPVVGTLTSSVANDSITVTLPSGMTAGSYRMRIKSSSPAYTGSNGNSFVVGIPNSLTVDNGNIAMISLCTGNTLRMTASAPLPGAFCLWTGPNGFTSNQQTIIIPNMTPADAGAYTVKQQWIGGCVSTGIKGRNVNVSADLAPARPTITSNSPVCARDTLKLLASGGTGIVSYKWYNINVNPLPTTPNVSIVSNSGAGNAYTIYASARHSNGCYSDTTPVNVLINPTADFNSIKVNNDEDVTCFGSNIDLEFTATVSPTICTYKWTGPGGYSAPGNPVGYTTTHTNVTQSGRYYVTATTDSGCVSTLTSRYILVDHSTPIGQEAIQWEWARAIVAQNSYGYIYEIAQDSAGYVYLGMIGDYDSYPGKFSSRDSISSYGNYDVIIAKYDSVGNFKWAKNMGSAQSDGIGDMAVDPKGNVFVIGRHGGPATFGSFTLPVKAGKVNIFITKLDSAGQFQWAKHCYDTTQTSAIVYKMTIAADPQGNCYFGVGKVPITGAIYLDGVIASKGSCFGRISSTGTLFWMQTYVRGIISSLVGLKLITDADANCYVAGNYGSSPLLLKIDPSGNILMEKVYYARPGNNTQYNSSIWEAGLCLGKDNCIYMAYPLTTSPLNTSQVVNGDEEFTVIMKIDLTSGNEIWRRYLIEDGGPLEMAIDQFDNIYITDQTTSTFACTNMGTAGSHSYIAKYNSYGDWIWLKEFPLFASTCIAITPKGSIYYSGSNDAVRAFGDTTLFGSNYRVPVWGKLGKADSTPEVNISYVQACDSVTFHNNSACYDGVLQSLSWDFGDPSSGTSNTSNLSDPVHKYLSPGTYTVTLTASYSNHSPVSVQRSITINPKPEADFSVTDVCLPGATSFNNTSTGITNFDQASWKVNPGNYIVNTPWLSYKFKSPNTYDVSLKVTNELGCADSITRSVPIYQTPKPTVTQSGNTLTTETYSHYTWYTYNFGNPIANSNTNSITASVMGAYYFVEITDANGCTAVSNSLHYTGPTAITLGQLEHFQLYPNPTSGMITLQYLSNNYEMVEMELYDVYGRKVYSDQKEFSGGENKFNLDLSSFPSGVYYLYLSNNIGKMVSKVIISR